ncbi:hypothetical protein Gohar_017452 [Gossypium harknessii]|uniref:Uncharacterized protein n=1 Tax=Gossypium harknessii TaxID=34285 RepID=A0A7J9G890_9ROSI|nr:hypothetical protein [Gossypium harknessii]
MEALPKDPTKMVIEPYLLFKKDEKNFVLIELEMPNGNPPIIEKAKNMEASVHNRNRLETSIGSDKLTHLLMVPQGDETQKEFYIDDSVVRVGNKQMLLINYGMQVVNIFFKLLKNRFDRFPKAYINHYSFDSQIVVRTFI